MDGTFRSCCRQGCCSLHGEKCGHGWERQVLGYGGGWLSWTVRTSTWLKGGRAVIGAHGTETPPIIISSHMHGTKSGADRQHCTIPISSFVNQSIMQCVANTAAASVWQIALHTCSGMLVPYSIICTEIMACIVVGLFLPGRVRVLSSCLRSLQGTNQRRSMPGKGKDEVPESYGARRCCDFEEARTRWWWLLATSLSKFTSTTTRVNV
jgi:hypothetical protein